MPGSGPNDFFVNFGSNAQEWATSLETQLRPANDALAHTKALIESINASAKNMGPSLKGALANQLPPEVLAQMRSPHGAGNYSPQTGKAVSELETNLASAADTMRTLVTGLEASVRAVQAMPGVIRGVLADVKRTGAGLNQEHGGTTFRDATTGRAAREGSGPNVYRAGTAELAVAGAVNRYVKQIDTAFGQGVGLSGVKLPGTGAGIQSVTGGQISTAGADRIVKALETQTKTLTEAIRAGQVKAPASTTGGGGGGRPPAPAAPAGAITDEQRQAILNRPDTRLKILDGIITALKAQGASEEQIAEYASQRAAVAKEAAAAERETLGITKTEQKELRKKAAAEARAAGPALTPDENKERTRLRNLINSAGGHDAPGLAKEFSKPELQKIADALSYAGFSTARTGTKAQIASRIEGSHAAYSAQYTDTVPDQLQPAGSFLKVDKISEEAVKLIGDVNGVLVAARQKIAALDTLTLNRTGGGGLPFKGAPEFGSGTFGPGVPGESLTTRGQVGLARQTLSGLPDLVQSQTEQLFRTKHGEAGFDPYKPVGIQGSGEQAEAYRLALKALRDMTTQADKSAQEFLDAGKAVEESRQFIDRARAREEQGISKPTDAKNVEQAWGNIARNQEKLALYTDKQARLYQTPEFQQGLEARRSSREEYNRRVLASSTFTPSARQDLKDAAAEAAIGVRTTVGGRQSISTVIPGNAATVRKGIIQPRDFSAYSNDDIIALRQASQHVGRAQANAFITGPRPLNEADSKANDEAFAHLENAATHLLNEMQRIFGAAPSIKTFTERPLQDPGNIASEVQRQAVRDAQAALAVAKVPKPTEPEKLTSAQGVVGSLTEKHQEAQARLTEATERAADLQERYDAHKAEVLGKLSAAEKAELEAAEQAESAARKAANKAANALDKSRFPRDPGTGKGIDPHSPLANAQAGPRIPSVLTGTVGPAEGPFTEARTKFEGIGQADTRAQIGLRQAEQRVAEALKVDQEVSAAQRGSAEQVVESTRQVSRFSRALETAQSKLAYIKDYQQKVQQIDAARAQGLQTPAGKNITRKDIAESLGLKANQITEILGPSRAAKPSAVDQKISDSLTGTMNAEERAAAGVKEQEAKATREVTAASKARVAELKAEQAALQKAQRGRGVGEGLGTVSDLNKAAAAAERRVSAAQGVITRQTSLKASKLQLDNSGLPAGIEPNQLAPRHYAAVDDLLKRKAPPTFDETNASLRGVKGEGFLSGSLLSDVYVKQVHDAITKAAAAAPQEATPEAKAKLEAARGEAAASRAVADAAAAAKKRLSEIRQELAGIASGGAGGTGKPPTARGAGGGSDDERGLLAKILAVLNQIHGTLQGGVRGAPGNLGALAAQLDTPAARARALTASSEEIKISRDPNATQEQKEAIAQAQRARTEALGKIRPSDEAYAQKAALAEEAERRQKVTNAELEQARAANTLERAMGTLSEGTRKEIAALKALVDSGASANRIVQQQGRVFNSVAHDLGASHVATPDRAFVAQQALKAGGTEVNDSQLASVAKNARAQQGFVDLGTSYGQAMGASAQKGFAGFFGNSSFWDRVMHTTGTFIVRNFAAGLVFGLTNELQQVLGQAVETETTWVRVSSALEATGKDVGNLRTQLSGISQDYGVQLNDVYEAAAGLSGLFQNSDDLAAGTRVVAQLQAISNGALNAQEATSILASTVGAFQRQAGEKGDASLFLPKDTKAAVQQVADVLTVVQNNLGVNVETTSEGVARMAGQAKAMKLSLQESAVFVAQIAKLTGQTGQGAGEQFSRILGALQTGRGRQAVLSALPSAAGDLNKNNYGAVLKDLVGGWDNLSDSQKRNITVAVAGQRQAAAFNALMANSQQTLNTLAKANDANGDAADRMSKLMETVNKRFTVFRAEVQSLASGLVRAGLFDFLAVVLALTNQVLKAVNGVFNAFNQLADSNPVFRTLKTLAATALGAVVAVRALTAAWRGLQGSLARSRGGAAAGAALDDEFEGFAGGGTGRHSAGFTSGRTSGILPGAIVAKDLEASGNVLMAESKGFSAKLNTAAANIGTSSNGLLSRSKTFLSRLSPADRLAGAISGAGAGLASQSRSSYAEAARLRSIYASQLAYAQLPNQPADGSSAGRSVGTPLSRAQAQAFATTANKEGDLAARTAAPNAGLERAAKNLEGVGRSADLAGRPLGKLGSGLSNLAQSGALANGALLLATVGLTALFTTLDRRSKLAQENDKTFEEVYGKGSNAQNQGDAAARAYQGKFDDAFQKSMEDTTHMSGPSKFFRAAGTLIAGTPDLIKAEIQNPSGGVRHEAVRLLSREVGGNDQGNGIFGQPEAQGIVDKTLAQIDAAKKRGASPDELLRIQQAGNDAIAELANKWQDDSSLSADQRQAGFGFLDQTRTLIQQEAENAIKLAQGLGDLNQYTILQLQAAQEAVSAIQGVGGQTRIGGLNVSKIEGALVDDVGAQSGSVIKGVLDRLTSGQEDSVQQAVDNGRYLKVSLKNLYADYISKLRQNGAQDADTTAAKQALEQGLSQYKAAQDAIQQAIITNANLLGGNALSAGNPKQALSIYTRAIAHLERTYRANVGAIKDEIGKQQRILDSLGIATSDVGSLLRVQKPNRLKREKAAETRAQATQVFKTMAEGLIAQAERQLVLEISETVNPALKAALQEQLAAMTAKYQSDLHAGKSVLGINPNQAKKLGPTAFTEQDVTDSQVASNEAAQSSVDAQKQNAQQARQDAAALRQAQLGVAAAWAEARGDAVAGARIQVQMAGASIAAARADLAAATTASETSQAQAALLGAQAQMIAAHAAVAQAQAELVSSQYDVGIALAEAAGRTVVAAKRRLDQAQAALRLALKQSGGKNTANVNQARAAAIQAEAAVRDARLQDELDTINFNLQMGRITQSSAIQALQHILKTEQLTKAQRQSLLLQIKGMKSELADSQWNFGDIKLPTPYQMRRYIDQRREQFRHEMDAAAGGGATKPSGGGDPGSRRSGDTHTHTQETTITIDGADIGMIKKVIKEVVGGNVNIRTTGPRRGRN